jgi:hypothetical protein
MSSQSTLNKVFLITEEAERTCVECQDSWPISPEFFSNSRNLVCIACTSDGHQQRRIKAKKTRGKRTPGQEKAHQAAKYLRHREQYLQNMRKYYSLHREEINAKKRAARAEKKQSEAK